MPNLAKNSPEKQWRNRPKTKPVSETPRDRFLHSKPWQYAGESDGRKFRILRERDRRLARALSRIDWSGECRNIFAAVSPPLGQLHSARGKSILERLRKAELNYPITGKAWQRQMKWSRPTVYRHLARLRSAGSIETLAGFSHYHGTRLRIMHPERLHSVPRESEIPTLRKFEIGSKSLGSKKLHVSMKGRPETHKRTANNAARNAPAALPKHSNSNPQTKPSCSGNGQCKPRTAADPLASLTVQQLREPRVAVALLNSLASKYPQGIANPARWPMDMLIWVLRATGSDPNCEREVFFPTRYVHRCVNNFLLSHPDWRQEVILRRYRDLPGVRFDGSRWVLAAAAVRIPKAIERSRRRDPGFCIRRPKRSRGEETREGRARAFEILRRSPAPRREQDKLERNDEPAQEKVESEWDRALRYREWCEAKGVADRAGNGQQ